jgi:hypothetical protein
MLSGGSAFGAFWAAAMAMATTEARRTSDAGGPCCCLAGRGRQLGACTLPRKVPGSQTNQIKLHPPARPGRPDSHGQAARRQQALDGRPCWSPTRAAPARLESSYCCPQSVYCECSAISSRRICGRALRSGVGRAAGGSELPGWFAAGLGSLPTASGGLERSKCAVKSSAGADDFRHLTDAPA